MANCSYSPNGQIASDANFVSTVRSKRFVGCVGKFSTIETLEWKAEKIIDATNVTFYGAVGDGVTDDTNAIQAALDSGFNVVFPKASYVASSTLTIPSNTIVDLQGSSILGAGFSVFGVQNVMVMNGKITNNGAIYPTAFSAANSSNITLMNICAENVSNGFILGDAGGALTNVNTFGLCVRQSKNVAYAHYNAQQVRHVNISTYNARWGMNIFSLNRNIQIVNAHFELGAPATTPTGDDSWYTGLPEHGLYAHSSNELQIQNITSIGWGRSGGTSGIKLRNFENITIDGGYIEGAFQDFGLFIQPNGGVQDYLRNVHISNVVCTGDLIFINDYVTGVGEIDVTMSNCTFTQQMSVGVGISSTDSVLTLNACKFNLGIIVGSTWSGLVNIIGCIFQSGVEQALLVNSDTKIVVMDCTFIDWNTSGLVPIDNGTNARISAIGGINVSNVNVNGCTFLQPTKRRLGFYGTVAGIITNNNMVNCFGGGDVWLFVGGVTQSCYLSNNTNYDNTLSGFSTAGNNVLLNDDTTVTLY